MIKLSKNDPWTRTGYAFLWSFLPLITLSIAISKPGYPVDVIICLLLTVGLTALNIYINYFDYNIFFDVKNYEWVVKRYSKEYRFKGDAGFKVTAYSNFPQVKSSGFYRFTVNERKFRFMYKPPMKMSQFFKEADTLAKNIQTQIFNTVQAAVNTQKNR